MSCATLEARRNLEPRLSRRAPMYTGIGRRILPRQGDLAVNLGLHHEPMTDTTSSNVTPAPDAALATANRLRSDEIAQTTSAIQTWSECLGIVQKNVSAQAFKTWFEPIVPVDLNDATLRIRVPSQFFFEWIEEHFYGVVRRAVVQVIGEKGNLVYDIKTGDSDTLPAERVVTLPAHPAIDLASANDLRSSRLPFSPPRPPALTGADAEPVASNLNARYTFENFVTGESNQLAYAAARAVADNPGRTRFNPLVIYGGVGLGKTHLAQAIGHAVLGRDSRSRVVYTTSERFTYEFVNAIQHNRQQEFTNHYRTVDVLIVDDIQFFADKEKTQDNFFHTFNALYHEQRQIVLTSDRPPKQLHGVDDRLISRFIWGMTADVQPPDLETRIAILQKMSSEEGYHLPGDIIDYIARNVTTSVRELEGCLISLLAECSLRNLSLTLDLTREVISGIATTQDAALTVEQVQNAVCAQLDVPLSLLTGKTRKQEIVFARQIAMYLIRDLMGTPLKTIGNHFGGRDHTTVMHAIGTIDGLATRDEHTRRTLAAIRRELNVPER